ncbi:MAG: hypothetical protein V4813_04015 [Gemmatimonadota bacterium]
MTPLTNPAVARQTPLRSAAVGGPTPSAPPSPQPIPYPSRPTPSIATPAYVPPTSAPLEFTPSTAPDPNFATEPAPFPEPATSTPAYSSAQAARPLVPPPPPSPGQMVSTATAATAATPSGVVGTVPGAAGDSRRVINPFLRSDPMTRAKRLARALVSDMVAYQPQKRADGLANGTLKQLFRDEIRKSYDEYVEQVGREVAESTAFFQDALNEVLADGNRVF